MSNVGRTRKGCTQGSHAARRSSAHASHCSRAEGHRLSLETPAELYAQVASTVRLRCSSWSDTERDDIVQGTILKLLEMERRGGNARTYTKSYLGQVARSVIVDEVRRRSRRNESTPAESEGLENQALSTADPEGLASARLLWKSMQTCIDKVPASRRSALCLNLEGYSTREVAERLGSSMKRAENLACRGKSDLRRLLRKRECMGTRTSRPIGETRPQQQFLARNPR